MVAGTLSKRRKIKGGGEMDRNGVTRGFFIHLLLCMHRTWNASIGIEKHQG